MPTISRNQIVMLAIELLLLVIVLILLFSNNQAPPTSTTVATIPPQRLDQGPAPEVSRVSLSDAHNAYTAKQAVFVDVRSPGQYEASHIPGAVSIPLNDVESRMNELDKEQWIITYCT